MLNWCLKCRVWIRLFTTGHGKTSSLFSKSSHHFDSAVKNLFQPSSGTFGTSLSFACNSNITDLYETHLLAAVSFCPCPYPQVGAPALKRAPFLSSPYSPRIISVRLRTHTDRSHTFPLSSFIPGHYSIALITAGTKVPVSVHPWY